MLRMRHEPEHISLLVAHSRDVAHRAVGILTRRVAKQHLPAGFQSLELIVRGIEATRRVLDRDRQPVADRACARECAVAPDHLELDLAEDELERGVRQQRAREEMGLAQHLKAVADPQHEAAGARELGHLLHHRGEAGDRARPQVVAIGEAAGHDHRVHALEIAVGVPQQRGLAHALGRLYSVDVVAGAGKANDPELHDSTIS